MNDSVRIIETQRIYLREFSLNDALDMYTLNLDPEVIRYTGDAAFGSPDEALNFLKNYDQYQKYGIGRWAVIRKPDEKFLGWCGLKYSAVLDQYDIGFRFFKDCWNKGFATEASIACIEYGLYSVGIGKITGRAMKENQASVRVLEKCGLSYIRNIDFDGKAGVLYEIER